MKTALPRILVYFTCASLIIAALTYANYRLEVAVPGGVDFLTHWVGTRALFHGESPYSDEVARRVQVTVYARPAQPGENEFLDPYLLYMEAIFAPFALIADYSLARAAWMTFLEICTLGIFLISLRIVGWKPRLPSFGIYILYALFGYHSLRPIINGNVTTVVTLMVVGAVWAIQHKKDHIAGVLVALALAKPNLTVVPVAFMLLWMASMRRWRFVAWLAGSAVLLVLAGMLIIPDWPAQNLSNILRYTAYNPPTTIASALDFFFPGPGRWIGAGIYALVVVGLIWVWTKALRRDFGVFLPAVSLTLVASQWLWISTDPGNFIFLTLPLALVLQSIDKRPNGTLWLFGLLGALLIGLWVLFLATIDRSQGNLQSPIMFFPLPLVILIGLYFSQVRKLSAATVPVARPA